ncbi:hypothetical protein ACE6H2_016754 [Prunus campanulata]
MKGRRPSSSSPTFGLLLVLVVVLGMGEVIKMGGAAPSAAQCHEERALAVTACMPVVFGKLPTPQCCERARVSHTECICPVITPKVAATIHDINRAVRLIEGCGRRVPRHFKCGSKNLSL